jgi:hypothetical protein
MSKIFDNSTEDKKFKKVLKDVIAEDGVKRIDMCVGYFNLRGWNFIAEEVDSLEGAYIDEEDGHYCNAAIALLSSNLFFLNYIIWSSCQVVNSRDFNFYFNFDSLNEDTLESLSRLVVCSKKIIKKTVMLLREIIQRKVQILRWKNSISL